MSGTECVTCGVYRRGARPRVPERPPVCEADRWLLSRQLRELADVHQRLVAQRRPVPGSPPGQGASRPVEPLGYLGEAGPVPGRSHRPRVSGSHRWSAPVPVDRIDLTLPARPAARRLFARGVLGLDPDQAGHLSVATVLDTWARDWRDTCWPGHHLPPATVPALAGWLGNRLDRACDAHPGIADFAAEIRALRAALGRAAEEVEPAPETARYTHLTCPRCDLRGVLMRPPGDPYVQCGDCGGLFRDGELDGGRGSPGG